MRKKFTGKSLLAAALTMSALSLGSVAQADPVTLGEIIHNQEYAVISAYSLTENYSLQSDEYFGNLYGDDRNFTIYGNGHTIDASTSTAASTGISIGAGQTFAINNATMQNFKKTGSGYLFGGAINNAGTITSLTGNFSNNTVFSTTSYSTFGGAVNNTGTITKIGTDATHRATFTSNSAKGGGAINNYLESDSTTKYTVSIGDIYADFTGNTATYWDGGAIRNYVDSGNSESSVTINSITGNFTNNSALEYNGGAISNMSDNGIAKIGSITGNFTNNSALDDYYGGAISNMNYGNVAQIDSVNGQFTGNYASMGGAISNYRSTITNIGTDANNKALFKGNGYSDYDVSSETGTTIATTQGGAIYNHSGDITNIYADFTNSKATVQGGAIFNAVSAYSWVGNEDTQTSTITNINGNFKDNGVDSSTNDVFGGAIINYAGAAADKSSGTPEAATATATIGNITGTFTGNYAKTTAADKSAYGGAIYNAAIKATGEDYDETKETATATITINGANFTGNYAQGATEAQGGAIWNNGTINFTGTNNFTGNYTQGTTATFGGAICNAAGTTMDITGTNTFTGNYAQSTSGNAYGGAIYNDSGATLSLNGASKFIGNYGIAATSTGSRGGAIYNAGTINTIGASDSYATFEGNGYSDYNVETHSGTTVTAAYGGAIYNYKGTIENIYADFTNNAATDKGGVIYNNGGEIKNLVGTFTGNYAEAYGGAIYNSSKGTIKYLEGTFDSNHIVGGESIAPFGGAICNYTSTAVIENLANSTFTRNSVTSEKKATQGGAIYNNQGTINFSGTNIFGGDDVSLGNYIKSTSGSSGDARGGAIYNNKGTITGLEGATFKNNYAQSTESRVYGGAIYNENGTITINNSTFTSNYADAKKTDNYAASGGAIYSMGGSITLGTNKFEYNYVNGSSASGGALHLLGTNVNFSGENTFTGNYAESTGDGKDAKGGAIYSSSNINSLIANFTGNYAKSTSGKACGGAIFHNSGRTIGSINGTFTGNYAQSTSGTAYGGAIYNAGTITNITGGFTGNYTEGATSEGGAIYNSGSITNIGTTDNKATFTGNGIKTVDTTKTVVTDKGGAIYNKGAITNINADFAGNSVTDKGGAVYNATNVTIDSINGNFSDNSISVATADYIAGGAIFNLGTIKSITGNFSNNTVTASNAVTYTSGIAVGGAIYNEEDATINNITGTFQNNKVVSETEGQAFGAAIANAGTMTISDSTFSGNTANGVANDIWNAGNLTFLGTNSLSGGISTLTDDDGNLLGTTTIGNGTDEATVSMSDGATLVQKALTINEKGKLVVNASGLNVDDAIANSGTIELQGGTLTEAIQGGNVNVTTSPLTIATKGSINQVAAITVDQALTVNGGTLYLNNNDTLNAQTTLTSGTLDINGITDTTKGITANAGILNISGNPEDDFTTLSANSSIDKAVTTNINCNLIVNGATVNLNGGSTAADTLAAGSTLIVKSGTLNISDDFVKSGRFIQQSADATTNISGNFTLSKDSSTNYGDNVNRGALNILDGTTTVAYGNNVAQMITTGENNAKLNLASGATLDIQSGQVVLDGGSDLSRVVWNGNVTLNGGSLTLANIVDKSRVANGATYNKTGILTAIAGNLTLNAGNVLLGNGDIIDPEVNLTTYSDITLAGDSVMTMTSSDHWENGNITVDGGTLELCPSSADITTAATKSIIAKSGMFNLSGDKKLILASANDNIEKAAKVSIGTDLEINNAGATVGLNTGDGWNSEVRLTSGNLTISGRSDRTTADKTYNQSGGSLTLENSNLDLATSASSITGGTVTVGDGAGEDDTALTLSGGTLTTGQSNAKLVLNSDSTLFVDGGTVTLDGGTSWFGDTTKSIADSDVQWIGNVYLYSGSLTLANIIDQSRATTEGHYNKTGALKAYGGDLTLNAGNVLLGNGDIIDPEVNLTTYSDITLAGDSVMTMTSSDHWENGNITVDGGTLELCPSSADITTAATKSIIAKSGMFNLSGDKKLILASANDNIEKAAKVSIGADLEINNAGANVVLNDINKTTGGDDTWSSGTGITLKDGNLTINNGNINTSYSNLTYNQTGGKLTINNGNLSMTSNASSITGGEVEMTDTVSYLSFVNNLDNKAKITMSGTGATLAVSGAGTTFTTAAGSSVTGGTLQATNNGTLNLKTSASNVNIYNFATMNTYADVSDVLSLINTDLYSILGGTTTVATAIKDRASGNPIGIMTVGNATGATAKLVLGNDATLTQQSLIINTTGTMVAANAGSLHVTDNIANYGTIELQGGTLASAIDGTGSTIINGDVISNSSIANAMTVNTDKSLTTNAANIGGVVTNNGTVTLTGGTLAKTISGGNIVISGDVSSALGNLAGAIDNAASTLVLTEGGTLAQDITGAGTVVIDNGSALIIGDDGSIANNINIVAGSSLQGSVEKLNDAGTITNAGAINLSGAGTLSKVLSGDTGSVEILSGATITSAMSNFGGTLINNGIFNLTGSLDKDIAGTNGTTVLQNNIDILNTDRTVSGILDMNGKTINMAEEKPGEQYHTLSVGSLKGAADLIINTDMQYNSGVASGSDKISVTSGGSNAATLNLSDIRVTDPGVEIQRGTYDNYVTYADGTLTGITLKLNGETGSYQTSDERNKYTFFQGSTAGKLKAIIEAPVSLTEYITGSKAEALELDSYNVNINDVETADIGTTANRTTPATLKVFINNGSTLSGSGTKEINGITVADGYTLNVDGSQASGAKIDNFKTAFTNNGTLNINKVTLSNNKTAITNNAIANIETLTLSGNETGIDNSGTANLTNVTLTGNTTALKNTGVVNMSTVKLENNETGINNTGTVNLEGVNNIGSSIIGNGSTVVTQDITYLNATNENNIGIENYSTLITNADNLKSVNNNYVNITSGNLLLTGGQLDVDVYGEDKESAIVGITNDMAINGELANLTLVQINDTNTTLTANAKAGNVKLIIAENSTLENNGELGTGIKDQGIISAVEIDNEGTITNNNQVVLGSYEGNGTFVQNNGMLAISPLATLNTFNNLVLNGGIIDMANKTMNHINANNLELNNVTSVSVDVDLANASMDTINANSVSGSGILNVSNLNILSDATSDYTAINFTSSPELMSKVFYSGSNTVSYTPVYQYDVSYNAGTFGFDRSYNPAILVSSAAQQGMYMTQINTYEQAFANMDMMMLMTKEQRTAMKQANKLTADATKGIVTYSPNQNPNEDRGVWFRPFASFENVGLDNGPSVDNVSYGGLIGVDSDLIELSHGWDMTYGVYAGYNGSHQHYDGNCVYQNGGTLGLNAIWYKDNFFTGLTANVGASVADAHTMYGKEDMTMLATGIASKTGYNWELLNSRLIIQPSFMMSYSFINTFDYTNAAGVDMNSDPLNAIQIVPGLKFIGNLPKGWQPYVGVQMIWNIMDKTKFSAGDIGLSEMSVDPYIQYGLGLQKSWGDRFTGFGQVMMRNGGRTGVSLNAGFRWALGENAAKSNSKAEVKHGSDRKVNLSVK